MQGRGVAVFLLLGTVIVTAGKSSHGNVSAGGLCLLSLDPPRMHFLNIPYPSLLPPHESIKCLLGQL